MNRVGETIGVAFRIIGIILLITVGLYLGAVHIGRPLMRWYLGL